MHNILFLSTQKINAWLWRRGFSIPAIRRMMLWQVNFAIVSLFMSCVFVPLASLDVAPWDFASWILAFSAGIVLFLNIFWGIARHIMRLTLTAYSMGLFAGFLLRMAFRMVISAGALYVLLVMFKASPLALVGGVTASMAVALGAFAYNNFVGQGQR